MVFKNGVTNIQAAGYNGAYGMPSEGPRLLLNIEGKNPNVPEHSVVHKESVDSENFCPIRDAESTMY